MAPRLAMLHSEEASLVLERVPGGPPLWRHLGARVTAAGIPPLGASRAMASFSLDDDVPFSTVPPAGMGWFGPPALALRRAGAAQIAVFGVAEVDAADDRIIVRLTDAVGGIAMVQTFERLVGGTFRLTAQVTNTGAAPLEIDWLASALIPLPVHAGHVVSWRGRHNAESVECCEPLPAQVWLREGRRGITGHGGAPGVIVLDALAGTDSGLVLSLQLAWSGDSRIAVERDDEGRFILIAGAIPAAGEIVLAPGESWTAPDALLALSTKGRNGAMAQQHGAVRARVTWPNGAMRPRPVHANSWEACYFDHDADRIAALAVACAEAGAERFVLDDGWFRQRHNDRAGLGDWTADPAKYPHGLKPLADRIVAAGMEFGLWVEPEMTNPDSDLYRAHPDWVLALEGRARPTARNQLVLDMSKLAVRDHVFAALDALLGALPVAYLKWDHNRDLAPAGGARQVEGIYDLLARVRAAHPHVEIESCAGGGGRVDAGIAAYTHRFWASDNMDAASRVAIQRGFLSFLPPEMMGAHIGACPAHATGRRQSLGLRAGVAMAGHCGIELDPRTLDEAERLELAEWIAFHRTWRELLHGGRVWLGEGADGLVWQAQGLADEFLLFVTRIDPALDRRPQPLRLGFMADAGPCRVELLRIAEGAGRHDAPLPRVWHGAASFDGSWLAHAGLPLPAQQAESVAIFHVRTGT